MNSPTENKLSQSSLNVMLTLFTVKSLIDGFRYSIFTLNISKWIIANELIINAALIKNCRRVAQIFAVGSQFRSDAYNQQTQNKYLKVPNSRKK